MNEETVTPVVEEGEDLAFPIEAYGFKQTNGKAFRRVFKTRRAFDMFCGTHDAQVIGTREVPVNER